MIVWIMDFESSGNVEKKPVFRFLADTISQELISNPRIRVVERTKLDKILEELQLGVSELSDKDTALKLGRILAAHLMISGQIIEDGNDTLLSFRVIETETGQVSAAGSAIFKNDISISKIAKTLADNITKELARTYPVRGKIAEIKGSDIILDIGSLNGVVKGSSFTVLNEEIVIEIIEIDKKSSVARQKNGKSVVRGQKIEAF